MHSKTNEQDQSKSRESVSAWLLDSDPSIRWQVMRDLTGESDAAVARERTRVAVEGWGSSHDFGSDCLTALVRRRTITRIAR